MKVPGCLRLIQHLIHPDASSDDVANLLRGVMPHRRQESITRFVTNCHWWMLRPSMKTYPLAA
jgi:hypothetical protein